MKTDSSALRGACPTPTNQSKSGPDQCHHNHLFLSSPPLASPPLPLSADPTGLFPAARAARSSSRCVSPARIRAPVFPRRFVLGWVGGCARASRGSAPSRIRLGRGGQQDFPPVCLACLADLGRDKGFSARCLAGFGLGRGVSELPLDLILMEFWFKAGMLACL